MLKMQGQHLFEYAVIRIVPRVEREEFFNVGVVLYCAGLKFLRTKFMLNDQRLRSFGCAETEPLTEYLVAMERICLGEASGGPISRLPIAERFRWLTATRSTVVQTSKVHSGFCDDASEMLGRLFEQLVL
jgi:hypothetical protein